MKAIKPRLFFRGIKIAGRKQPDFPAEQMRAQSVEIPMRQHIGAPAKPCVKAGERVLRGQMIGEAQGAISANVHASIAGTVTDVREKDGDTVVAINSDGTNATAFYSPLDNPTGEAIAERVREAGVVGMGGAGFPTHVKLSPQKPVRALILNGAECEPYLTCDDCLMRSARDKIVRGAKYLARAIGAEELYIGIEKNKPQAIALFEETELKVVALRKRYPMGSEKHLIYCCTGRKVPVGKLPADVGVIVQNVATAFSACEAVEEGKPLIERIVTVAGGGAERTGNFICQIGTPLSRLAEACGMRDTTAKIVVGGPMTGKAIPAPNGAVTKTCSGLLFLTKDETSTDSPTPCINCGKCADVCPMKLMPMQIEFYTACKDYKNAERYGGVLSCIGCGACGYICPARRPLAQAIGTAKRELGKKESAK